VSGYEEIKALSKETGVPVPQLIALHRDNDPFFVGTPRHREMAEWFAELWARFGYTSGVHLRRVHYRLVHQVENPRRADGLPYRNTESSWGYLCHAGKYARILGLVAPEAFVDRRNPHPRVLMHPDHPHQGVGWESGDVEWGLPRLETDLAAQLDEIDVPYLYPTGYDYRDSLQPYHVEVWVEKSTMEDELLPLCRRHAANLVTGLGNMSITSVVSLLRRVEELEKPTRILYVSDYDPAGVGMPVSVARQVEFWRGRYAPDADIQLQPIILTAEQVAHYTAPPLPRIPIKDTDLRKDNFEARHGVGAVELDALEAVYPGEFARIVGERIAEFRDPVLPRKVRDARLDAYSVLEHELEESAGDHLAEMEEIKREAAEILARYQEPLEALSTRIEAELAPLRERLEVARQGTQEALDTLDPELPELPEPETQPEDDGWLFDADRDYFEQLASYKAYQRR
jgi:hypothetical protein